MKYEIWDNHTHLVEKSGATPEARLGAALKFADRFGISRLVLFMGTFEDTYNLSPEQQRRANDMILRAIKPYPDLVFHMSISTRSTPRRAWMR